MRRVASTVLILLMLSVVVVAAESPKSLFHKGQQAEARGDYEGAYEFYRQAYDQKPQELKYRVPYERLRFLAAASKVHRGQKLRDEGKLQDALTLFEQAAAIDPSNDLAAQEVRRTQQMIQKQSQPAKPTAKIEEEDPLRQRLEDATPPVMLAPLGSGNINALELTEDSKVAYETIGKLANINVLFDPDYTSRRLTLRLRNVSIQDALDIVALESRTFWRPVTANTIFVAQDTQAKRRELEQNVVKTFYLGNVSGPTDLQDIVNAIRTVLEVQRIQQIPSQSAIVIKGTPDQLALAEKMINDIDKAKPEVIVDVIVAQVRRDKLRDLGITPPQNASVALQNTSLGGTTTNSGGTTTSSSGSTLNFNDLQHLNSTNYAVVIDPVKAVALFNDNDAKLLQTPRIRATDNEKATLKIADKIPIATGSFGTPVGIGTATGAIGVNTQFQYTDVGVILEITPRVHPDGQVTLKTVMEISNLNGSTTIGGITQPIISTRRVEHTIRLNDGEINLLGGINEDQETRTTSGTPFLGQIPLLKYLFSSENHEKVTNEIVFLLVPHIVRNQELSDLNKKAFDVGTGSGIDLHIAAQQPPHAEAPQVAEPAPGLQQRVPAERPQPAVSAATNPAVPANSGAANAAPNTVTQPSQPAATSTPATPATEAAPSTGAGPITLRLDPGAVSQKQGSTFSMNVVVGHGQDISAVPVQISYDPKVLQFVSVANGDYLSKDGQTAMLVHRDDPVSGKLQVTAQRQPGTAGVNGDGTVFSLVFSAKAKGNGTVAITIPAARNSRNQPLEVLGSQAIVKIE